VNDERTRSTQALQPSNRRYLETTLTKKLISSFERELNNACEFIQLFRSVSFDVGNALETMSLNKLMGMIAYLKIRCKLLNDGFPGYETLYEDVCRF